MKKIELLSPAGDMESLRQAVYNGADAVYIAGHYFGARKFAKNFTNEEIIDAIKFCHLYGVKVYVTMNTLIYDHEVDDFINQARFLYENGVDALIVQDFGMICMLRDIFPNLEIHASTQANNSSIDSCKLLHKLGVKRVVLSRELDIEEINKIDIPIEKEVFIHGALCISYSGRCLMSSMLGGRSGNRGECAGCCRMPYSLSKGGKIIEKNKYLLSTKELNTTEYINELKNSNIDSLKIEGRMKSPLYVGFITHLYRRLLDGENISLEDEINKLKIIFNREFTKGRIFYENDINIMNTKSPNHIGLKIGKAKVIKNKIQLLLDKNQKINQNDAIRFSNSNKGMMVNFLYDEKMKLCSEAEKICYVDNKIDLKNDDILYKTQDYSLEKEYLLNESRYKIPISFYIKARIGNELIMTINDGTRKIVHKGNVVSEAINAPISDDSIKEKISKIGNTPFTILNIEIERDDNCFIQIKQINELRRLLLDDLIQQRQNSKTMIVEKSLGLLPIENYNEKNGITCSVTTEDQLIECLKHNFLRIYVSSEELYEKYKDNKNIVYSLPKCAYNYEKQLKENNLVNDVFEFKTYNNYGGYQLNITNAYTAYYLVKYGLKNIPLSCEMSIIEIEDFIDKFNNYFSDNGVEILSYGRVENMLIKGNILNLKPNCYEYELINQKQKRFPVFYDGINTHVLNHEKLNFDDYKTLKGLHRFDFYDESQEDIKRIVNQYEYLK